MKTQTQFFAVCFLLVSALTFQYCASSKPAAKGSADANVVSYAKDIQPIMLRSCAPCHFPDGGKKKFLDTYASVKTNYKDIMDRVQLPADHEKYMPFKSKKPAFTPEEIAMLKKWAEQGMAQ